MPFGLPPRVFPRLRRKPRLSILRSGLLRRMDVGVVLNLYRNTPYYSIEMDGIATCCSDMACVAPPCVPRSISSDSRLCIDQRDEGFGVSNRMAERIIVEIDIHIKPVTKVPRYSHGFLLQFLFGIWRRE